MQPGPSQVRPRGILDRALVRPSHTRPPPSSMTEQASFVKIPCFTNPVVGPTSSKLVASEFLVALKQSPVFICWMGPRQSTPLLVFGKYKVTEWPYRVLICSRSPSHQLPTVTSISICSMHYWSLNWVAGRGFLLFFHRLILLKFCFLNEIYRDIQVLYHLRTIIWQ